MTEMHECGPGDCEGHEVISVLPHRFDFWLFMAIFWTFVANMARGAVMFANAFVNFYEEMSSGCVAHNLWRDENKSKRRVMKEFERELKVL